MTEREASVLGGDPNQQGLSALGVRVGGTSGLVTGSVVRRSRVFRMFTIWVGSFRIGGAAGGGEEQTWIVS